MQADWRLRWCSSWYIIRWHHLLKTEYLTVSSFTIRKIFIKIFDAFLIQLVVSTRQHKIQIVSASKYSNCTSILKEVEHIWNLRKGLIGTLVHTESCNLKVSALSLAISITRVFHIEIFLNKMCLVKFFMKLTECSLISLWKKWIIDQLSLSYAFWIE